MLRRGSISFVVEIKKTKKPSSTGGVRARVSERQADSRMSAAAHPNHWATSHPDTLQTNLNSTTSAARNAAESIFSRPSGPAPDLVAGSFCTDIHRSVPGLDPAEAAGPAAGGSSTELRPSAKPEPPRTGRILQSLRSEDAATVLFGQEAEEQEAHHYPRPRQPRGGKPGGARESPLPTATQNSIHELGSGPVMTRDE